jgi:hypothetical protein
MDVTKDEHGFGKIILDGSLPTAYPLQVILKIFPRLPI